MAKKAYHHGNLREALLQSARETLAGEGIEALSLRTVAKRTGVSATALYSHFKDKQELLTMLATQGFDELAVEMEREQACAERGESTGGLIALARGYVQFATQNPALFQLMFGPAPGEVLAAPQLQKAGARAYGLLEADVARRMEELGIPDQTPVATAGAWALVHGLSSLLNDGRVTAEKLGLPDNAALTEQVCGLLDIG
ncbi:putative HTH-type transcriptional regulator [Halioglobus japonicus]|nr:putative HTH-type transcriptional regulator [Halioglobus japonicus]